MAPAELSLGFMWCFSCLIFHFSCKVGRAVLCMCECVYRALKAGGDKKLWVAGGPIEVLTERGRPLAGLSEIEKDYNLSFQRHFIVKSHACWQARSRRSPWYKAQLTRCSIASWSQRGMWKWQCDLEEDRKRSVRR